MSEPNTGNPSASSAGTSISLPAELGIDVAASLYQDLL